MCWTLYNITPQQQIRAWTQQNVTTFKGKKKKKNHISSENLENILLHCAYERV